MMIFMIRKEIIFLLICLFIYKEQIEIKWNIIAYDVKRNISCKYLDNYYSIKME